MPFVVVQSDGDSPRALVTEDLIAGRASEYQVALTCTDENEANRFVFQYSHELAHFYFTPDEHPLLEICAVAASLCVLTDCAMEWRKIGKGSYADKFEAYRNTVERNARIEVGLGGTLFQRSDILRVMPRDSVQASSSIVGASHIVVGSLIAREVMQTSTNWTPLLSLHRFLVDKKYVDFDLWLADNMGDSETRNFKNRILTLLAPIFHVEEPLAKRKRCCCACIPSRFFSL